MLETIRAWLNGNREYYTGVAIYSQVGTNEDLLEVLKKGPNDFRTNRLQEDLLTICNQLKSQINENATNSHAGKNPGPETIRAEAGNKQQSPVRPCNPTLYDACKLAADQQYKKVMNARAVLFNLAAQVNFEDPNTEAKINDRVKLALEVVQGYQLTSQLYDRADYVKLHGRLPDGGEEIREDEYDHLQDHLVKLRLDNARKAYNKLKIKEATPERIALMQAHAANIEKLENKWNSLKP